MHRHPNIKTQAALDAVADAATLRRYLRDSDHDTHTLVVAYVAGSVAADIARGWFVDGGLTLSWPTTPTWPWDAAEKAAELAREAAHDALLTVPALAETDMRTPPVFDCGHTTSFPDGTPAWYGYCAACGRQIIDHDCAHASLVSRPCDGRPVLRPRAGQCPGCAQLAKARS